MSIGNGLPAVDVLDDAMVGRQAGGDDDLAVERHEIAGRQRADLASVSGRASLMVAPIGPILYSKRTISPLL